MGFVTKAVNRFTDKQFTVSSVARSFQYRTQDGTAELEMLHLPVPKKYELPINMDIAVFQGSKTAHNLIKQPIVRLFFSTEFKKKDLFIVHKIVVATSIAADSLSIGHISEILTGLGFSLIRTSMKSPYHSMRSEDILLAVNVLENREQDVRRFVEAIDNELFI